MPALPVPPELPRIPGAVGVRKDALPVLLGPRPAALVTSIVVQRQLDSG
eukprot:CAMPEP_0115734318 /NCGR_PEP_ID=MMETSP0272-20121206/86126_1 /TAXON_ID=71861 /ORGANISM="Scrippsiella trochoidea, Strain CCMP3099" /LENGTH=48 /DNA_ID= /DNA_START= /DNA_END= /DNA_ORIENTATION=